MSHFNNYRTKAGEQVRITEWFQVVSWNKVADLVINTVRKGSRVRLKGKLRSTMWKDESGFYHRRVQIVATEMKQAA
jgi:single-strand DNA-binding protein